MSQGQGESIPRRCPRCGGLMAKPAGSSLYWHADSNHPRCDITNIVDPLTAIQTTNEPAPSQPEAPKSSRGKQPRK